MLDHNRYTQGVKRALTHDYGVPDHLSLTPREAIIGHGKGAAVGVLEPNGIPGPGSPLPEPRPLTDGEKAAAVKQRDDDYRARQKAKQHTANQAAYPEAKAEEERKKEKK